MLEAGTVFTVVSLMMLANGAVLAIVARDFPAALRPAARYWQVGTLLIALGCAVFAFGGPLPRWLMLVSANGPIVLGLTAYLAALQRFGGQRPAAWQWLPALAAIACVAWFSVMQPDFRVRVIAVSAVWCWLMLASAWTLVQGGERSRSRSMLAGLFVLVALFAAGRLAFYLGMMAGPAFAVETGQAWINLVSPMVMTLLPIIGTTAFLLMCSDHLRRQLETAAATDYLTGLPNRRPLADSGRQWFREATERGASLAVAVLDIDRFKAINDTHGHDAGDRALVHIAEILRAEVPSGAMIARTGGEEFAVLFRGAQPSGAIDAVERMRLAVARGRFIIGGRRIPLTISAGVALCRPGDQSFEDMLRRADQALYAAKSGGRNRVEMARLALVPSPADTSERWG